jgi:hypothetical protein
MNKKIQTYDDLLEEKKRLEELLIVQKQEISANWVEVKESLKPVNNIFAFFGKLTHRDKSNPIVNMSIDIAGDLLLKRILLARAGWLTRLAVPYILKNYSSNVFSHKGKSFVHKIKHWLKGHRNGEARPVGEEY